jgi:MoxR-like ATPase
MGNTDLRIYVYGQKPEVDTDEYTELMDLWLKSYPPWRAPVEDQKNTKLFRKYTPQMSERSSRRGSTYVAGSTTPLEETDDTSREPSEEELINLALMLRRPLLVEGKPGVGKSTLAYHIAWHLGLGEPLRWEINSRTKLSDGLYEYRAVEHLRDIQKKDNEASSSTGKYITLGPLGTAFVPSHQPRVLLIDELDKAQFDLPNDLLHILEEAEFKINELINDESSEIYPYDFDKNDPKMRKVQVSGGRVRTYHHPVVIITSNGDREFPPAFLRRCIKLKLNLPTKAQLEALLKSQFAHTEHPDKEEVIRTILDNFTEDELSNDQYLQQTFAKMIFGVDTWITELATKRDQS